jgi:uncharacterized membrane protein affecting hemolysin expression
VTDHDTYRDAQEVLASLIAGPLAFVGLLVLGAVVLFYAGRCSKGDDVKLAAKIDTVRITQQARAVAAETVTVKLKAKARVDTIVSVVTDTELVIRASSVSPPETVTVRPQIVERIRVDSALIGALRFQVFADSNVIRAQSNLIRALKPSRCGRKCGFVIGAAGSLLLLRAVR